MASSERPTRTYIRTYTYYTYIYVYAYIIRRAAAAAVRRGGRTGGTTAAHPRWHRGPATQVDDTGDHTRARANNVPRYTHTHAAAAASLLCSTPSRHCRRRHRRHPDNIIRRITYARARCTHAYNTILRMSVSTPLNGDDDSIVYRREISTIDVRGCQYDNIVRGRFSSVFFFVSNL